ncbi:MAG: 1-deoxy-D-xylulose-5-phosphate synthase [Acidobacteria bacterium 13_1_20CM_3_53_8]|nr:MAG: 1-deoxy-D-xylulose-5-phosphate synthase [Acidobacteria bacterium 13_1_20CM_3_53_8]
MYIEHKLDGIVGPARIGRIIFSKSGKSLSYKGREFVTLDGRGFKANYADSETGERYWISGCKKDGTDALYSTTVEIDDDIREEYWIKIRNKPESKDVKSIKSPGKYSR